MCEQMGLLVYLLPYELAEFLFLLSLAYMLYGESVVSTWKALPTHPLRRTLWRARVRYPFDCMTSLTTCVGGILTGLKTSDFLLRGPSPFAITVTPMVFLQPQVYVYDKFNDLLSAWDLDWFTSRVHPYFPCSFSLLREEARGGFSRLVTMSISIRGFSLSMIGLCQVLRLTSTWMMSVLRSLPQDEPYHQTQPSNRLVGQMKPVSPFDLSSATDRWPVLLFMFEVFQGLFWSVVSLLAVVNSALATLISLRCHSVKETALVQFVLVAGQPLGYYSSWALCLLCTHHLIRIWWCAAEEVYPGQLFDVCCTSVMMLGDDVFITDDRKRQSVVSAMVDVRFRTDYQISLDLHHFLQRSSLIEFAKRFLVDGSEGFMSDISITALANYFLPYVYAIHDQLSVAGDSPHSVASGWCRLQGFLIISSLCAEYPISRSVGQMSFLGYQCVLACVVAQNSFVSMPGIPITGYLSSASLRATHHFVVWYLRLKTCLKSMVLAPDNFFEGKGKCFKKLLFVHESSRGSNVWLANTLTSVLFGSDLSLRMLFRNSFDVLSPLSLTTHFWSKVPSIGILDRIL
uniref:RNA-dependent RNA polymerase n=1 Tax=Grapevine mitovirus 1 TaxID=3152091 RepID=A0AAU7GGF7_9VIRU